MTKFPSSKKFLPQVVFHIVDVFHISQVDFNKQKKKTFWIFLKQTLLVEYTGSGIFFRTVTARRGDQWELLAVKEKRWQTATMKPGELFSSD